MIIENSDPFTQASFPLWHRALRQVWDLTWLLLFRPSPRPMHKWRAMLLRLFGARLGSDVHVYPSVQVWAPWNLKVGNRVGIGDRVIVYSMDQVTIGDGTVISQGTHLCGGSHDYNSANFQLVARPIAIGRDVWICAEAFVAPGVSIPDGAVVGARSVVSRTLGERWTVYAGVPCHPIGTRTRHAR